MKTSEAEFEREVTAHIVRDIAVRSLSDPRSVKKWFRDVRSVKPIVAERIRRAFVSYEQERKHG